jgi:hypothetical protein
MRVADIVLLDSNGQAKQISVHVSQQLKTFLLSIRKKDWNIYQTAITDQ